VNISPLVSVLVTVYNRETFISDTVKSILDSTFTDFELIIVDDCSKDRSAEIAQAFEKTDHRIRFIQNAANLGDYGNRMKAASIANGKYIKYVDSDDLIYNHSLKLMVEAMERYDDCVLGLSHGAAEDERPYPWRLSPAESYEKHFLKRGCFGCGPTGAIIRREEFLKADGFNRKWGVLSDTELWLRLAARHSIVLLPPGLVWWRRHDGQEFTKDNAKEVYLNLGHQLEMRALNPASCPLSADLTSKALQRSKQHYARKLLAVALKQRHPILAVKLFRDSQLRLSDLLLGVKAYT
jgi:glycosyltransferase involved in cell wall biosynthesis